MKHRLLCCAALVLAACAPGESRGESRAEAQAPTSGSTVPGTAGDLTFEVPADWKAETPTSSMRVAQYELPGDDGAASLVVYWFGGSGGTVDANIARWVGQFQSPEGGVVTPVSETTSEHDGLTIHELELYGTYVAEVRPGAAERVNEPGWGLLAAVVVAPQGPYFIKVVGPEGTIRARKDGLARLLASVRADG